jgi:hypothetical protein
VELKIFDLWLIFKNDGHQGNIVSFDGCSLLFRFPVAHGVQTPADEAYEDELWKKYNC